MRDALRMICWAVMVVCVGCSTSPIDISGVRSEAGLDVYLGKRVSFTGSWRLRKECGISNGFVLIVPQDGVIIRNRKPLAPGSVVGFSEGQLDTATG
jgi:hypothetical protein